MPEQIPQTCPESWQSFNFKNFPDLSGALAFYHGAESLPDDAREKTLLQVIDHNISTVTVNTKWCNTWFRVWYYYILLQEKIICDTIITTKCFLFIGDEKLSIGVHCCTVESK